MVIFGFDLSLLRHRDLRTTLALGLLAAIPFILRSVGDSIVALCKKCCKDNVGKGIEAVSIDSIISDKIGWNEARKLEGLNWFSALMLSAARLIFWHWMQPFLYWFLLYAYWDLLDGGQQILGLVVGGRECIYFLMTTCAVCIKPAFLMPDLKASCSCDEGEFLLVVIYIIAPEKYVYTCIAPDHICSFFVFVVLTLMDLCGVVAFVWAFVVQNVYIPIIMGYAVTACNRWVVNITVYAFCITVWIGV